MRGGWYCRHRFILELWNRGELSLFDSGVHDFLYQWADFTTGLVHSSAEAVKANCPCGSSVRTIQRSLERLQNLRLIKCFRTKGRRGNYPVLLCHYVVRDVSGNWFVVNAERTTDWRQIQYDPVADPSAVLYNRVADGDGDVTPSCRRDVVLDGGNLAGIKERELREQNSETKTKQAPVRRTASPSGESLEARKTKNKRNGLRQRLKGNTLREWLDSYSSDESKYRCEFEKHLSIACEFIAFKLDVNDPEIGEEFAFELTGQFDRYEGALNAGKLTRGNFCSKVIDGCEKRKILWPTAFTAHRDRLRQAEGGF
jgi:hypothetical protein